jgi:hypothetical protein
MKKEFLNTYADDLVNKNKMIKEKQQEKRYSEEEVVDLLYKRSIYQEHYETDAEVREWFNKYKKK